VDSTKLNSKTQKRISPLNIRIDISLLQISFFGSALKGGEKHTHTHAHTRSGIRVERGREIEKKEKGQTKMYRKLEIVVSCLEIVTLRTWLTFTLC
jgi:hypothetical protein